MKKIIALVIFVFFLLFLSKTILWSVRFMEDSGLSPGTALRLIFNHGSELKSRQGKTNILIMGVGGGEHEGNDLTDTMMVLSIDTSRKTSALISLPRDIWSETLKDRINSAYHYGKEKSDQNGGLLLSKVVTEDILGIPIHYSMVIDFSGFERVIDEIGGIDVTVPVAFTDPEYPCESDECIYKTIHFDSGLQHMDGARALIYARSRHAEGNEGSDFARSKRQQIIIITLKNKLVHPSDWFTITRMKNLPNVVNAATKTDMNMAELLTVGKWFAGTNEADIKKISIEDKLEVPPSYVYGRYVLVPKEDWKEIHDYIQEELTN